MKSWLLLAALVNASPALKREGHNQVVLGDDLTTEISYSESYIDQLYGQVVNTDASAKHKQNLLNEGIGFTTESQLDFVEISSFENAFQVNQYMHQLKAESVKKSRQAAHNGYLKSRLKLNLPHDDDVTDISSSPNRFGGILTFAGFNAFNCFDHFSKPIDIAIVGAPFDTGTSFRPGARFGPESIRLAARRLGEGLTPVRGNSRDSKLGKVDPYNPKSHNLSIVDCGDVPMTPFDNRVALNQLYRGQRAIHNHTSKLQHPKIITMGGDHTITLMALRSAYEKFGQLAVLHFDSHIDTWDPKVLGGGITDYMSLNHGTFLHYAAENGYLSKDHCFHLGLRAPYISPDYDIKHDVDCGFRTITARDLDTLGREGIVSAIKNVVGDLPVYISVDIDVLDPANAPGTGTMEIGGWTGRELLSVLDGLEGINLIGGDVVEVSPPYDTNSEITSLAATAVIDSLLGLIIVQES